MVLKPGPPSDTVEPSSTTEPSKQEGKEESGIPVVPSQSSAEETNMEIDNIRNPQNNETSDNTNPGTSSLDINDFIIILEIRPLDTPRISKQKFVKKQEILNQLRTKHEKSSLEKELFMGEIDVLSATSSNGNSNNVNGNSFTISSSSFSSNALASSIASTLTELKLYVTFNSNHSSWDYSWKSNRWLGPNEYHVIDIIVLKYYNPTEFQVYSNFVSTPFIVVSSHKKSNIGVPPSISDDQFNIVTNHSNKTNNDEQELTIRGAEMNENSGIANILIMSAEVDGPATESSKKKSKKTTKPSAASRKRSLSAASKANPGLNSSYGEDMNEVMEGAQLLSNLFGKVITLPTKPTVEEEEDVAVTIPSNPSPVSLPAPPPSANSSSSPRAAPGVVLTGDALVDRNAPIQLPSSALHSNALEVALPATLSPQTSITIPVPMPAYPSKKVAIVHDRHARSYEVHYPALTLIEEVRGTYTINGGKRRRVRKNHPQIPSNGGLSSSGKEESDGELHTTSNQAKLRGSNHYRNHRQLPDKDPQTQYKTIANEISIEDSANQLLMLASKDHMIESPEPSSTVDYRTAATAASTTFEDNMIDHPEEELSVKKRTTRQSNVTSTKKYKSKKQQPVKLQSSNLTVSTTLATDTRYLLSVNDYSSDDYSDEGNVGNQFPSTIHYPNLQPSTGNKSNNSGNQKSSSLELCLPDKEDYNQSFDLPVYATGEDQILLPSSKGQEKSIAGGKASDHSNSGTEGTSDDAGLLLLPRRVTSV